MQKHVEVDEPEATEVPLLTQGGEVVVAGGDAVDNVEFERMSEEDLLRGLEDMPPAESPGSQRNGY
jgi:DNA-directed RNA polymerase subunit omega